MCGRVTITVEPDEIATWLRVDPGNLFQPRFNVAPTQQVPVVRFAPAAGHREAVALRWGFVPHWSPDLAIGNRMINARSEGVFQKSSFREAIRSRRCVVPVSGFYEWKASATPRAKRQPFVIRRRDRRPFALAAFWERNEVAVQTPVETFAILTTSPNRLMQSLHDRMPVILPDAALDRWLDASSGEIKELLTPYAADDFDAVPVSDYVNSPAHEGPECLAPPAPAQELAPAKAATTVAPVPKRRKSRDAPGQGNLFD